MAFGTSTHRSLPARGASPGFRFTLYAILSITLMFLDQRSGWLNQARYLLQGAAYPIQLAVNSPAAAWNWMQEALETREQLRAENQQLKVRQRELDLRMLQFQALLQENAVLRGLKAALPPLAERWLAAEVVNVELNSLRQRVLVNRGTSNGIFKAQAVLDDHGLLGQTTHVGPWSAEVILITDPEHAVPVQIERTGLRTIAVGAGNSGALALPYLPANADIKKGDLLITSGLGGVFPAGYPVARVAEVHRDAVQPLAQVRATPLARIDGDREVMLVWFREDQSAQVQPQKAPPHAAPKPAAVAATTVNAPTASSTSAPSPSSASSANPSTGSTPDPTQKPASASKPAGATSTQPPAAQTVEKHP